MPRLSYSCPSVFGMESMYLWAGRLNVEQSSRWPLHPLLAQREKQPPQFQASETTPYAVLGKSVKVRVAVLKLTISEFLPETSPGMPSPQLNTPCAANPPPEGDSEVTTRLCGMLRPSSTFPAAPSGILTSSTSCSTSSILSGINGHCTHISKRRNTCSWHLKREKY